MARKVRIQYPGAIYHVMNRGDRREAIFEDSVDRDRFLATLGEACEKTSWQIHAYGLMRNHFHLLVETPQPNLVIGMKWLLGTYTSRFNRRHKQFGHLFSGRYKALPVQSSADGYFKTAGDYVHLNPARAGLLESDQPLRAFQWSSFPSYLAAPWQRAVWLRVDRLFGEWGIPKDSEAGRRVFEERMEWRRREDLTSEFKALQRGWCLGGEQFRQELLEQVNVPPSTSHFGPAVQEAAEARAERMTRAALQRIGWTEDELKRRPKGDPDKIMIALELRKGTTMSIRWIARRLCIGTPGYLACLFQNSAKQRPVAPSRQLCLRYENLIN